MPAKTRSKLQGMQTPPSNKYHRSGQVPNPCGINQHKKSPSKMTRHQKRQQQQVALMGQLTIPLNHPFYLSSQAVSKAGPHLHQHIQDAGDVKQRMKAMEEGLKRVHIKLGDGLDLGKPYANSCMLLDSSTTVQGINKSSDYHNIQLHSQGRGMKCHAFVLTAMFGPPVPKAGGGTHINTRSRSIQQEQLVCMHKCHNKDCVNPMHMAWGSCHENHWSKKGDDLDHLWVELKARREAGHKHWVPEPMPPQKKKGRRQ